MAPGRNIGPHSHFIPADRKFRRPAQPFLGALPAKTWSIQGRAARQWTMVDVPLTVYLDEAGYTGADLANRDQRVYVLASINLSDEVAKDVVARCFVGVAARELSHSTLSRRPRGRQQILAFIEALAGYANSASVSI